MVFDTFSLFSALKKHQFYNYKFKYPSILYLLILGYIKWEWS